MKSISKNLKFAVLVIPILAMVTACSSKSSDKSSNGSPAVVGQSINKADYPNEDGTVYGGWRISSSTDNGIEFKPSLFFNRSGKMGVNMECVTSTGTLVTYAEVRIKQTVIDQQSGVIEILEPAEKKIDSGGKTCTVTVGPGRSQYEVTADGLTLKNLDTGSIGTAKRLL